MPLSSLAPTQQTRGGRGDGSMVEIVAHPILGGRHRPPPLRPIRSRRRRGGPGRRAEGCVLRGRGSIQGKRLTITMVTVVDPITERSQKAMKEVD